jgi:hypothetical protein
MGIRGPEKTAVKKEIMKLVDPWLRETGFQCVQAARLVVFLSMWPTTEAAFF